VKAIAARHYRIGNHEITVEEELQDGDASAGDGAMAGRIRRMGGGAFGESLRKEIIPIPVEAALHRLGVEHVVVHVALKRPAMASQNLSHNRAARLGTVPEVNRPFLIPHAVQRKASDCRERGRDIGTTERAEAVLLGGTE
jgi:hypothetical protein